MMRSLNIAIAGSCVAARRCILLAAAAVAAAATAREGWQVEPAEYPPAHCDMENAAAVRAMYRDILEKMSDFALVPSVVRQDNLGAYAATNLDYAMNGTVEITPGGKLMAGWISGEDGPKGFFVSNESLDRGETWTGGLLLEPLECSYPDMAEGPDGTLYVTYDHQRDRAAEIRLARFTEEDVRAGKLVTSDSKLGLLVFKGLRSNLKNPPMLW